MNEVEKATELVDMYRTQLRTADKYDYLLSSDEIYIAKQCAKIVVDEIKEILDFDLGHDQTARMLGEYWDKVKTEIELL